jgi:hypothetical protein
MAGKTVYAGEWIESAAARHGHRCQRCSSPPGQKHWYSIKTGEIRCRRCFNARHLHEAMVDILDGWKPHRRFPRAMIERAVAAFWSWPRA